MSYDISLYRRDFPKHAIEEGLGDWTAAPPIPSHVAQALVALALSQGFVEAPPAPEFVAFTNEQGFTPSREFNLDTASCLAQLHVFSGQLAFTISHSDRAAESIALCSRIAKAIAREYKLGYDDPQSGDDIFQE